MVKIDFHLKWCYLHLRWCYLHLRWCYLRWWLGAVLISRSQPKTLQKIQKNLRWYITGITRFLHVCPFLTLQHVNTILYEEERSNRHLSIGHKTIGSDCMTTGADWSMIDGHRSTYQHTRMYILIPASKIGKLLRISAKCRSITRTRVLLPEYWFK